MLEIKIKNKMAEIQLPKQVQDKIMQFESFQQQLQLISLQKQQLMRQNAEIENALDELGKIKEEENRGIYRAVGPLFIETNEKESKKKLGDEKETLETRIKIIEKEEKKLTERLNKLRNEVQNLLQSLQAGAQQESGGGGVITGG